SRPRAPRWRRPRHAVRCSRRPSARRPVPSSRAARWRLHSPPSDGLTDLERQEPERLLAVVSRTRPVDPLDYVPRDLVRWRDGPYELRAEVAEHLGRLVDDAAAAGLGLRVISGFRSYRTQAETHASWVRRRGRR